MALKYNPLARLGFDEAGTGGGSGSSGSITPNVGEVFFPDDYRRFLNYIARYSSDEESTPIADMSGLPVWSVRFTRLKTIDNGMFKRSHLRTGEFPAAELVDVSAFEDTSLFYINSPGKGEWGTTLPNVKGIKAFAFAECRYLREVSFPKVEKVGSYAFRNCTGMYKLELPICTDIFFNALQGCSRLEELNLPMANVMYGATTTTNRLYGCTGLRKILLPNMYKIADNCRNLFLDCVALEEIDINSMKYIPHTFFTNKIRLERANVSDARYIGYAAFSGCQSLTWLVNNNATEIHPFAFHKCTALEELRLPSANNLDYMAISDMYSLKKLELLAPGIIACAYSATHGSICNNPRLTEIKVPPVWSIPPTGISFANCSAISAQSVIDMAGALKPAATQTPIAFDAAVCDRIPTATTTMLQSKNYNIVRL